MDSADGEALYPCVGICLPDADEDYCIGCGRPWTTQAPVVPIDTADPACAVPIDAADPACAVPPAPTFEEPDQRTSYSKLPPT